MNKNHTDANFRDSVTTIDKEGKRVWIFPQKPKGKLYNLRTYTSIVYLAFFFGLPFVKYNSDPLFLFNIIERKFILFGVIFWPQDFFLFGLGMLVFILFVILFTVVFGRVFCGWACPQTVFMEMVFRKIEYWIEGDFTKQKQLSKQPWNREKIIKRGGKLAVFFLLSFIIATTFLSYIIGVDKISYFVTDGISNHLAGFTSLIIFTAVFFGVYAWFREQVCIVVCPYGRLQGVLLDKNSVIVAYDYLRGEPREKFHKKEQRRAGDCVDCHHCVNVCPTGIDIRNGTQLECVNCTACIDACNNVMEKVGLPQGLIRYDSENGIAKKAKLKITPRMAAYSVVLLLLITLEGFLLVTRSSLDATVMRTPGQLYQKQTDSTISNLYTIKLANKTRNDIPIVLKLEQTEGDVKLIGKEIVAKGESLTEGEFFIILNRDVITERKTHLQIGLYSSEKKIKNIKTTFLGPVIQK